MTMSTWHLVLEPSLSLSAAYERHHATTSPPPLQAAVSRAEILSHDRCGGGMSGVHDAAS